MNRHTYSSPSQRAFTSTANYRRSSEGSNSMREGFATFRPFVRPFTKVFLGAAFTYQVVYWSWLMLETNELKLKKEKEIGALERTARELAASAQKS